MQINKTISTQAKPADHEPSRRFERKFFVPPKNIGLARILLQQICRPDKEHPKDRVTSLYFDTPDLDQYARSESGDFKKDKIRIRWYSSTETHQGMRAVFLELKSREGFASSKQRQRLLVPAQRLEQSHLGAGIVDKSVLLETLAGFGNYPESPLKPIIVISYWRYRLNEIFTGTRVSFDYDIRSYMVSPELGYWEQEIQMPGAIIEVKGTTMELPITLRRIKILNTDWSRFSKYGNCIDAHLQFPGTVGRLWPSGRMVI